MDQSDLQGRLWEAEPSRGGCSQFLETTRGAGTRAFCMSLVALRGPGQASEAAFHQPSRPALTSRRWLLGSWSRLQLLSASSVSRSDEGSGDPARCAPRVGADDPRADRLLPFLPDAEGVGGGRERLGPARAAPPTRAAQNDGPGCRPAPEPGSPRGLGGRRFSAGAGIPSRLQAATSLGISQASLRGGRMGVCSPSCSAEAAPRFPVRAKISTSAHRRL